MSHDLIISGILDTTCYQILLSQLAEEGSDKKTVG